MKKLPVAVVIAAFVLTVTGCGSSTPTAAPKAEAEAEATIDPIAAAITERWGECLIKLKFTEPFDITVYSSTHKADVSSPNGVIGFRTGISNTGKILLMPDDSDNSARALASVGC